jgi:hypothetical protein
LLNFVFYVIKYGPPSLFCDSGSLSCYRRLHIINRLYGLRESRSYVLELLKL